MNILYITFDFNLNSASGGAVVSLRNYDSLLKYSQTENLYSITIQRKSINGKFAKLRYLVKSLIVDFVNLSFGGLDTRQKQNVLSVIAQKQIHLIFLDSSLFGSLAKHIRHNFPDIRIISYFHNNEYCFIKQKIKLDKTFFLYYRLFFAYINEKRTCIYSDYLISINERDAQLIETMYRTKVHGTIPVSLKDIKTTTEIKYRFDNQTVGLFVGSYFYANTHGICWFIDNVLPYTNIKLIIAGKGMNKLRDVVSNDKIEIFDYVDNLETLYNEADFIILPIFFGSGMKVKTAEALMFGKYIFGTDEAFSGYEICETVGTLCNTKSEFITAINLFTSKRGKFNNSSRELFLEKYIDKKTFSKFCEILSLFAESMDSASSK